LLVKIIN